ncbi:MAG: SufS family cysteine desulfurase [Bacteroidales bacterium]|nr:SufS family cysteine desulfurase [Bacteroidales bacterium]
MKVEQIRKEFPLLEEKVYGKQLVYLDNAATIQRPRSVVEKWNDLTLHCNSNLHRAVHKIAADATEEYETTRDAVRDFLNAESRQEIIFTSGATASINLVAFSFGEAFVKEGDEIIVAESEHHSNIVPWQMMCNRKKASIKVLPVDDSGCLCIDRLENLITDKTRLIAVAQISNVLGVRNPIKEVVRIAHSHGVKVLVDGAQGVVHDGADVRDLDCDFYAFSGHKVYAAPGTGVLYGKKEILDQMPPYMGGGEMIAKVKFSGTTYAPLPGKYEAGTQNMAGTPTLKPALEMAKSLKDKEISEYHEQLTAFVLDALESNPKIHLYGNPEDRSTKTSIFSFTMEGVHHEDLALILDKMGIAVRSGQMCAEPLMDRFGVTGMLRASFAHYNTMEEAAYFIKSLDKAASMLL